VYRNFDWDGALAFTKKAADLSERVMQKTGRDAGDGAVNQWFKDKAGEAASADAAGAMA